ncbi:MAG TPA: 3-hydroxybutyrate dehydrogenase [Chitinophagaceae bacterium]|nr:3-hydroxybutyrate dehydrogenase [Chitinophagaceae bacterium]
MKRTVLITGATSGIGKAIAIKFAKEGYNIVFDSIDTDGEQIAQSIADEYKIQHLYFAVNIIDKEAVKKMVSDSVLKFGSIDILINNAGIQFVSPIDEFPDEKWDAIIGVNLSSAFHLTKAVWPKMKEKQFGRIINIASAHGLVASAYKSAYVASKHGIIGFTKAIALEGAEFGITCNAICPGYVHTAIIDKQIPDQMKAHNMTKEEVIEKIMLDKQAIKEFISADLIADATLFLANENARTITGISLPIEGGWTAE